MRHLPFQTGFMVYSSPADLCVSFSPIIFAISSCTCRPPPHALTSGPQFETHAFSFSLVQSWWNPHLDKFQNPKSKVGLTTSQLGVPLLEGFAPCSCGLHKCDLDVPQVLFDQITNKISLNPKIIARITQKIHELLFYF